ncbi:MAG TPA: serine/threonine-protein kinase [Kofleriaceae bacterium]
MDEPEHDAPHAPSASFATTVRSPLEALEHDEILRTRWFCFIGLGIGLLGAAAATVLPGDRIATRLFLIAVGVSVFGLAFLYNRTRDPIEFRRPSTSLGWFIPAACASTSIPFFGAYSPVSLVLVLGVYFTGLGRSLRLSITIWAVCSGMELFVGMLVVLGAHDTGLIRADSLSTFDRMVVLGLVQAVLFATLITARMSRRTTLLALGELESAVRVAAHREALLLEAREELDRALRPGRGRFSDQAIGAFSLGALLGRGAMGEVYEAQGPSGVVAIKLLSQSSLGNPTYVLRFLRELRTAAGVHSPHVARVIEVGEQPVPYLVMERLDGQSLAEVLRGRGAFSPEEAIELARHVGSGITAAADAGIVHRDLKPQNVFRDRDVWKVLDFGVAREADHDGNTLTKGDVVGTPSYMAPEQASGSPATHASDLYALAAIVYRAVTGQPAYAGGEIAETLYRVVNTRPRRPSDLARLPDEIDLVLAIGMARSPRDRFATAAEFVTALEAAFAQALPQKLVTRGLALDRCGAWAPNRRSSRAPTKVPT